MKQIELTTSEVNTIIAALMLTASRYDATNKNEALKYRDLENKMRKACYKGDNIATIKLSATFKEIDVNRKNILTGPY